MSQAHNPTPPPAGPVSPLLALGPAQSTKPGTQFQLIDLAAGGPDAPVKGSRFVVDVGGVSRLDSHEVTEVWLVAAGRGTLTYDGHDFPIAAFDAMRFAPGKTHTVRNDGDEPLVLFSLWWSAT